MTIFCYLCFLNNSTLIFQIIDQDINPHVDQWEAAGAFPAREVFKKLGNAGLLGVTKPTGERQTPMFIQFCCRSLIELFDVFIPIKLHLLVLLEHNHHQDQPRFVCQFCYCIQPHLLVGTVDS